MSSIRPLMTIFKVAQLLRSATFLRALLLLLFCCLCRFVKILCFEVLLSHLGSVQSYHIVTIFVFNFSYLDFNILIFSYLKFLYLKFFNILNFILQTCHILFLCFNSLLILYGLFSYLFQKTYIFFFLRLSLSHSFVWTLIYFK